MRGENGKLQLRVELLQRYGSECRERKMEVGFGFIDAQ